MKVTFYEKSPLANHIVILYAVSACNAADFRILVEDHHDSPPKERTAQRVLPSQNRSHEHRSATSITEGRVTGVECLLFNTKNELHGV